MLIDVVLEFPTRADAVAAATRTAAAHAEGLLGVHAAALVWTGRRGRARVVHGLPLTRDQRAEHRLMGIAPLIGVSVDVRPAALGILPGRVPDHLLDSACAVVHGNRVALALRVAVAQDTAPVLTLAELTRGHGPVRVVTTTLEPCEAYLLDAALVR